MSAVMARGVDARTAGWGVGGSREGRYLIDLCSFKKSVERRWPG